jgi:hypothetical protein
MAMIDRQLERFQSKVQRRINLADDEIQRLSVDLQSVKAEICEVQDQLRRKTIQTAQLAHEIAGREKRQLSDMDITIAKMRSGHHVAMQESDERHKQEISALHQSFQEALAGLEEQCCQKIASKSSSIDELLAKSESEYSVLQESLRLSDRSLELESLDEIDDVHELEHARQVRLEAVLETRNQERLDSLLQWKSRLADCVAMLEETERDHTVKMAVLKNRLETMDQSFTVRSAREKERQQRLSETLRQKAANIEKRARAIQKTIQKIERHHATQLNEAIRDGENTSANVRASGNAICREGDDRGKVETWKAKREELRNRLGEKENELAALRTDNESMAREVARLKHESQLTTRRSRP